MKLDPLLGTRFFFATAPMPCPYLPGRVERRILTELAGRDAPVLHEVLTRAGFRRSHDIAYAPVCPDCDECKSVRVIVDAFRRSPSMRRVWNANRDLRIRACQPSATDEQYALFAVYQKTRHGSGEMARMDLDDYKALIENSAVGTSLAEFRDPAGTLVGACLYDCLGDGLSAVYSFFEPDNPARSLGSFVILWLIEQARSLELPYAYLGYWIAHCGKMAYKARFGPLEVCTQKGWVSFDPPPSDDDPG